MSERCTAPIPFSTLVDYWLDDVDDAAEARIDEHLLGCAYCSDRSAEVLGLARGIREAFAGGQVHACVTGEFARRLVEKGLHVREYRVPANGSVQCTVSDRDDVLLSRLQASLSGISRLDLVWHVPGAAPAVLPDIPFDVDAGEVVVLAKLAALRSAPSHQQRLELVAVEEGGQRVVADYTFNHTAAA
jgi:hypothetical protein